MTTRRHLTEDERQSLADGSLATGAAEDAAAHIASCVDCAADVARLRTLMTRLHTPGPTGGQVDVDELWPTIREAIEASKIVPLDAPPVARAPGRERKIRNTVALVAAGLVFLFAVPQLRFLRGGAAGTNARLAPADSATRLVNVADSSNAYEEEANALLNDLQMRRAMMHPQASAALDRDLRSVDQAIAEVKDALVRDPNNPALRRLLASSYRQKVELLKRATNAG